MGAIILQLAALIFILDAAFLFGKASPKGTGVANAVVGMLIGVLGLSVAITSDNDPAVLMLASLAITFAGFYLILAVCLLIDAELDALGWYCLGAALWVLSAAGFYGLGAGDDRIFAVFAMTWTILFFAAWQNLALGHTPSGSTVKWILALDSVVVLMIPAYIIMVGSWPPFDL